MARTLGQTRLAAWLLATQTSQRELGRRIGVGGGAVCRYANGDRLPERREALAIERETGIEASSWDEPVIFEPPSPPGRRRPLRAA